MHISVADILFRERNSAQWVVWWKEGPRTICSRANTTCPKQLALHQNTKRSRVLQGDDDRNQDCDSLDQL